jgi:O-antigen/teichoic acid export membrane protein
MILKEMKINSTVDKIAKNTVYQIVGKVVSMSITMLAVVIITRTYGREGYGYFSLMQSWPALFFVIVDFGINAIAAKDLTSDWSKANKYLGNIIIMRLIFSSFLVFTVSCILKLFPYSRDLEVGIRLGMFLLITQSLYSTTNIFFQVKLRYDFSTIAYTVGYLLILGLVVLFSLLKINIMWVNFSYVLGGLVTVLLSMFFVRKMGVKPDFSYDPVLWKYLIITSLPIGIMFVFSQMSFKEDALMLSFLKLPESYGLDNTESVAVYALPYKVFEVLLVVPTFFMNSVYPILVERMNKGKEDLKHAFSKVMYFLTFSGLFVGFLGIIFSPLAIKVLGGSEFSQSIDVLRILSAGLFIFYLTSPFSWLIVTLGYQKYLPWVYLISFTFNMVSNFIFIPKYSFYAASWVTVVSECIVLILLAFFAKKSWKLKYGAN